MSKTSEIRKELWDYLLGIGVKLTPEQHDQVKEIVERYVREKSGLFDGQLAQMNESNAKMNAHHSYYHKNCQNQPPPKKKPVAPAP